MSGEMRECYDCKSLLPRSQFYCARKTKIFSSYCKTCHKHRSYKRLLENPDARASAMRSQRKWRWKNPDYFKRQWVKNQYGITNDQWQDMLDAQDSTCLICKKKFSQTPCVDHCHKTGVIRGLLCQMCNRGLGYFRDNISSLSNAITYLNKHRVDDCVVI